MDGRYSSATYNLGADDRWSFCQFGNAGLAAAITDTIQRSTSGTFTSIAGAPKAEIIDSVLGFVMALHTNESTYGDSPDRWWCSALYDETSWTANVSTQATTGRLIEGAGKFTAGARLGDDFIAYKQRALFLGALLGRSRGVALDADQLGNRLRRQDRACEHGRHAPVRRRGRHLPL
jgi:hypothetical protein